jgi:spore coat polysaccharide biosynthesis protein SpsF (cytidylyltransferase family)
MKDAIIINTRIESKRIPGKSLYMLPFKIGRKDVKIPVIYALVKRLLPSKMPIVIACPESDINAYQQSLKGLDNILYYTGHPDDPLKRMTEAANKYEIDNIVRVCHDKVFMDHNLITQAMECFKRVDCHYLYSSFFTEGSGFEIISRKILNMASSFYRDIEHVSYAIKNITDNIHNWHVPAPYRSDFRLLIDYPEDLPVIEKVFRRFKTKTLVKTLPEILDYLRSSGASTKNKPPLLTVYSCCYNAELYLPEMLKSLREQKGFRDFEVIFIDDASKDKTNAMLDEFCLDNPNCKLIRNSKNIGLASSSNVALKNAKGLYITRIDADDYYASNNSLQSLLKSIRSTDFEAIYPNNYYGDFKTIQRANECHHIGGAIFNKRSINTIKFTDGLRGYEGLDFFKRAKDKLNIGYLDMPIFYYRQHPNSMTKENNREYIKEGILNGITDKKLAID